MALNHTAAMLSQYGCRANKAHTHHTNKKQAGIVTSLFNMTTVSCYIRKIRHLFPGCSGHIDSKSALIPGKTLPFIYDKIINLK